MRILIRTDASVSVGIGHVMRCLTLADQLRREGAQVVFVCNDLPGNMFNYLQRQGYQFSKLDLSIPGADLQETDAKETVRAAKKLLPDGIDWVVVDHYGLDANWERMLQPHTHKLMVIDDLANRPHDCDLLLDQNYYRDQDYRYQSLVSDDCVTLVGPTYALLREEFVVARQRLRTRNGTVKRILVCFGGGDSTNQTRKALDALSLLSDSGIAVDIVVGDTNPHQDEIQSLCKQMKDVHYHCQATNMAELIAAADIAIGAGGATTWERCSLGLPTLTVVFADNQLQTTQDLEEYGAIQFLGWADEITVAQLANSVKDLIANPDLLENLSARASFLMREWVGVAAATTAMKNIINY